MVGSHLCEKLVAEGWEAVCFDSLLAGSAENLADPSLMIGSGSSVTT